MSALPLELDYDTSMVRVADRHFPACLMVCPDDEDFPEPDPTQRSLGGEANYVTNALIPVESGFVISVDMEKSTGRLWCHLWSRTCEHSTQPDGDEMVSMWLPHSLKISNSHGPMVVKGFQSWNDCESWWLIEYIDRVATLEYYEPPGPKCDLIRLVELDFGYGPEEGS